MDQMMEGLKTSAWHWFGQKSDDRHRPRSLGQKKDKGDSIPQAGSS